MREDADTRQATPADRASKLTSASSSPFYKLKKCMKLYSQRDPRWASYYLGNSRLIIGRYGCTTTAIAMLSTYFLPERDPGYMSQHIQYTNQGLIIWQSCNFEQFLFDHREYGRVDANIQAAIKDPNRAVILEVANHSHWVVAVSYNWLLRDYKIADPWTGSYTYALKSYKNITGAAYFKKKVVS